MKNIYILSLIWLTLCLQCAPPTDKKSTDKKTVPAITVGVFDGHGGAQTCIWETLAALRLDPGIQARTITSAEIAEGILDSLDAIVIPGGSGSRQYLNLGSENQKRIRDFIADGHGAVGICAGAYLFSNTPGYACMALNGAQAIDIEHDNRGHGLSKFTLNEEGKKYSRNYLPATLVMSFIMKVPFLYRVPRTAFGIRFWPPCKVMFMKKGMLRPV